ncbi:MAG: RNA polymerase sigma factor [Cyclobacteriaceae bacterium]
MPQKPGPTNVCDEKVFSDQFKAHSRDVHNFLYYKFGDQNFPQDIVQVAFLKLWDNCEKVTPEKARSYLFTVAYNQMLKELSKKKTALNYAATKPKSYTVESPDYVMEENEYMIKLQEALMGLTDDQREAFLLNRIEDKKHKEIAEMLGISRKTVEKRIYAAVRILNEKLKV